LSEEKDGRKTKKGMKVKRETPKMIVLEKYRNTKITGKQKKTTCLRGKRKQIISDTTFNPKWSVKIKFTGPEEEKRA